MSQRILHSEQALRVVTLVRLSPPIYSGGGLQSTRLAAAIARKGVHVRVLTALPPDGSAPAREVRDGLEIHRVPGSIDYGGRAIDFGVRAAWWLMRHRDWDLLHTHGFSYWTVPPTLLARLRGRPVIVTTTLLGADDPASKARGVAKRVILPAYRRADAHVALSEEIEQVLEADGGCRGRILRIPNGVDVERFRPPTPEERSAARERRGFAPEEFVVVACGALIHRKNVSGLARAAALSGHRPARIVLAGPPVEPAEVAELEHAIAALPSGVAVTRLGHLGPDEVPELLWAADCFTLNSRAEGLPLSLCEGMASGLPCVATDIPGCRDVLSKGGGLLVPLADDAALARAWDELASDPARRARLGAEARSVAEQHYAWSAHAERYVELYHELLAEKR
jgi:glycosyltransferase involved in cell wall biosynthesis